MIILSKCKKDYYKDQVNNIDDPKHVWNKLDEICGRNTSFSEPISIVDNGKVLEDPKDIAEEFNNFYQKKVRDIIQGLPPGDPPRVAKPPEGTSFKFHKVNIREVRKHIFAVTNSRAAGHDGINNVLLKAGIIVVAPVLTKIINNCIRTAIFPATWKVGRITVLHKKGSRNLLNNYRPITLLCSLSKIFERVLFKQMLHYFGENQLMDPRQYGFRPGRSCAHAVIDYLTTVLATRGEQSNCRINALLVDLSAAFDIVNHDILLNKLKEYGFKGWALKLIKSYLTGRVVYTEIENRKSRVIPDLYGVPQGSVLGPLLYIVYVICLKDHDQTLKTNE